MDIQNQIDQIIQRHKTIVESNPDIAQISFDINNLPYQELETYRENFNAQIRRDDDSADDPKFLTEKPVCGKIGVFIHSWHVGVEKLSIHLWTGPVKITTIVTVTAN